MSKFELKIEFETISEMLEFISWINELEKINLKEQIKRDKIALGEEKEEEG